MDLIKMVERIEELCCKKGVKNPHTAYINSGVGKDFGVHIKKGSAPSVDKVQALADYFDVSIDYLVGRTQAAESHKSEPSGVLTADEKQLIENFRAVNREAQEKLLDSARDFAALDHYKKFNQLEMADEA